MHLPSCEVTLWSTSIVSKNTLLHVIDHTERPMPRCASAPALLPFQCTQEDCQQPNAPGESVQSNLDRVEMERLHHEGSCSPCLYFAFKRNSCHRGSDCKFCHLCTRAEIRAKKSAGRAIARMTQRQMQGQRDRGAAGMQS